MIPGDRAERRPTTYPVMKVHGKICEGPVINYGEGRIQNGKIGGQKPPFPPQNRVKLFAPPFSVLPKLQSPLSKLPQNFVCPKLSSVWLKPFLFRLFP